MTGPTDVDGVVRAVVDDDGAGVPDRRRIAELVRRSNPLLPGPAVDRVVAGVQARVVGLGPLDPLLADEAVTDVLVNGPGPVWVDRAGRLQVTEVVIDRPTLDLVIERVLAPLGRRVDPVQPMVDGRLPDGSRVHIVVPPVAVDGPCLAIRRFGARRVALTDLASPPVADLLRWAVRSRANVVVVGGTGSGKTTLLNALAASIPAGERIVTVEDAAELRLETPHVVRLETRAASVEGVAPVTARDLVRAALRLRPDRLLLGEVRGGEALDLVTAMNIGHDGSLSTLHANGCADALRRLETLVLFAGVGLPHDAVRDHLRSAVDLIVHIARDPAGRRRVVAVAEVDPPGTERPAPSAVRPVADERRVLARPGRPPRADGAGPPPEPTS